MDVYARHHHLDRPEPMNPPSALGRFPPLKSVCMHYNMAQSSSPPRNPPFHTALLLAEPLDEAVAGAEAAVELWTVAPPPPPDVVEGGVDEGLCDALEPDEATASPNTTSTIGCSGSLMSTSFPDNSAYQRDRR